MVRRFALVALIVAGVLTPAAQADHNSRWYWSPGWCKSQLQNGGVELGDGRYFYVAKAFCIGLGGPEWCEWNRRYTARDYAGFYVIVRSYDSNVRTFYLYPTGRDTFTGRDVRLRDHMGAAEFNRYVGYLARTFARAEHEKGCAPYRG